MGLDIPRVKWKGVGYSPGPVFGFAIPFDLILLDAVIGSNRESMNLAILVLQGERDMLGVRINIAILCIQTILKVKSPRDLNLRSLTLPIKRQL